MDKKDRIITLIDYYCAGNKAKFASKLGVTPQTISTWISRNTFDVDKVFAKCDSVSAEWLLTGNGNMLNITSIDNIMDESAKQKYENKRFAEVLGYLISSKTVRNQQEFVELIQSDKATVSQIKNGKIKIPNNLFERIRDAFPNINIEWLQNGNGEMLSTTSSPETADNTLHPYYTYLLPMSAAGGSLSGFDTVGVGVADCEKVISPIADIDFAISVYGDSMAPEYPSGSRVLIKKIDPEAFIVWGNVFVLDTVNGIIVKEVQPSSSDGKIVCHSLNPCGKYKDFEVSKVDIRSMYRVLACITAK